MSYHISYCGLEGDVTVAHFHRAPIGSNGPVVHTLTTSNPIVGFWSYDEADEPAITQPQMHLLRRWATSANNCRPTWTAWRPPPFR